jgi:hypothetical protein
MIEVKYVSMRSEWCSTKVVGTYGVSIWKHIRRGWDNFQISVLPGGGWV